LWHVRREFDCGLESDPARSRLQQPEEVESREEARRRGREAKPRWIGHRERRKCTEKVQEVVDVTR
jgi:hypothetical protein